MTRASFCGALRKSRRQTSTRYGCVRKNKRQNKLRLHTDEEMKMGDWTNIPDQYVEVEGVKIRYIEKGEGRPLLCVHGMGATLSADQFLPHIDRFAEFSHVYALDLPGWGLSDHVAEGATFPLWVRIVKGFCDALAIEEMDIFGYSIGGWVATIFAHENPQRVRRFIQLDAPGMNVEAPAFVANFQMPDKDSMGAGLVMHMGEVATEEYIEEVYRRLHLPGREEAFKKLSAHIGNTQVRTQYTTRNLYPDLKMPILLSQMDNAGAVVIRHIFDAYQLAENARVFIYYGGTSRLVGGIRTIMEDTAVEFLTAGEVPPARVK
jgi:pimeloyl-ACP methyl ester carboxylesterase